MIEDDYEILEWYSLAGVDECCGESPWGVLCQETKLEKNEVDNVKEQNVVKRQAITGLAQSSLNAKNNAKDLCKRVSNLEELYNVVIGFEGCSLKLTAANTVFGDGNPNAKIMFIGEAPGADEDRQGKPFVGRSGKLLDKMLSAIDLKREDCFITNILPWRPPGNRTPQDAEIAVCLPFLYRQIELVKPEFIFLLGGSAANAVLDCAESISKLRGRWLDYETDTGEKIKALASFHPAYLLRNSGQKAKAWADLLRLKKALVKL